MIIDASVALKWLVPEDGSDRALLLLARTDLMAPTLIHAEVANGLLKKSRRGELAENGDFTPLMDTLANTIQAVDEMSVIARALRIALMLTHSMYDCVYLALAEQLGQELVTADQKFLGKVSASELARLARAL